jgi:hypothetical protein
VLTELVSITSDAPDRPRLYLRANAAIQPAIALRSHIRMIDVMLASRHEAP